MSRRTAGTDPSASLPFEERLGQCYVLAGRYVLHNEGASLVHGSIGHPGAAIKKDPNQPPIGHAWAVDEDGMVFEPASGEHYPAEVFKRLFGAVGWVTYTHAQAARLSLSSGHWGPWDEEYIAADDQWRARFERWKSKQGSKTASSRSTYWRVHAKSRPFSPEDASSTPLSGGEHLTAEGVYSCFEDPWHLWFYVVAMGWHADRMVQDDDVIEFTGTQIGPDDIPEDLARWNRQLASGRGHDGENLVKPDSLVRRMSWAQFEQHLLDTPLPERPMNDRPFNPIDSWDGVADALRSGRAGLDTGPVVDHLLSRTASWGMPSKIDWGSIEKTDFRTTMAKGDHGFYSREQALNEAGMPQGRFFESEAEIEQYVRQVVGDRIGRDTAILDEVVILPEGYVAWIDFGRHRETGEPGYRITLPASMTTDFCILHEVAHLLHRYNARKYPFTDVTTGNRGSHGAAFARELGTLLWEEMGIRFPNNTNIAPIMGRKTAKTSAARPDWPFAKAAMPVKDFKGHDRNMSRAQVLAACQRILKDVAREFGYKGPLPSIDITPYLPGTTTGRSIGPSGEYPHGAILLHEDFWLPEAMDKEYGYSPFRTFAHEAIHALIQQDQSYPGIRQIINEGAAEILSIWYWARNAPEFDQRDAQRVDGAWVVELARHINYEDWVVEVLRRAASKVGWNPEAIVREVQRLSEDTGNSRLIFRDTTDPDFPCPPGVRSDAVSLMTWLISGQKRATAGRSMDESIAEIAEILTQPSPNAPGIFDHLPEPKRTTTPEEWRRIKSAHPYIYRGMSGDEDLREVGHTHWSTSRSEAAGFASLSSGDRMIMLTARFPDIEDIETDPAALAKRHVFAWAETEQEVPLRPGTRLEILKTEEAPRQAIVLSGDEGEGWREIEGPRSVTAAMWDDRRSVLPPGGRPARGWSTDIYSRGFNMLMPNKQEFRRLVEAGSHRALLDLIFSTLTDDGFSSAGAWWASTDYWEEQQEARKWAGSFAESNREYHVPVVYRAAIKDPTSHNHFAGQVVWLREVEVRVPVDFDDIYAEQRWINIKVPGGMVTTAATRRIVFADSPFASDYGFSIPANRIQVEQSEDRVVDPYDEAYFKGAGEKVVSWVDFTLWAADAEGYINFMATAKNHEGQGHARALVTRLYEDYPNTNWDWGRVMSDQAGTLWRWFQEHYPDRTSGQDWYSR